MNKDHFSVDLRIPLHRSMGSQILWLDGSPTNGGIPRRAYRLHASFQEFLNSLQRTCCNGRHTITILNILISKSALKIFSCVSFQTIITVFVCISCCRFSALMWHMRHGWLVFYISYSVRLQIFPKTYPQDYFCAIYDL